MSSISFSFNILSDFQAMLQYPFMQHAFEAGTIIAIVAGVVGYFVVLRRLSFAADTLAHAGFTGAAGAVVLGLNPMLGLFAFTSIGGVLIAIFGRRAASRDVQIGVILAFLLGLGVLFINLYTGYATEAYSILFGEILGISSTDVLVICISGFALLAAVAAIYRPLLFTSLDEEVAAAKGVPVLGLSVLFMLLIAVAISIAVQMVGVLLIFALMVTPAAVAQRTARRPARGVALSVCIALLATWSGLFISFYVPYPVSFFITSITFAIYLAVRFLKKV